MPQPPPVEAWESLDHISLTDEFRSRVLTLKACPSFIRGRYRHALRISLEAMNTARQSGDEVGELRAWKLFGLLSILILHRTSAKGSVGKAELENRCDLFARGEWRRLLDAAKASSTGVRPRRVQGAEVAERKGLSQTCDKATLGERRHARRTCVNSTIPR